MSDVKRRVVLSGLAALAATSARAAPARAAVTVGVNDIVSDAPFYIAMAQGLFERQGLDVSFVHFDTGPAMVAPLATGQLDAAGGALSAGLYNAVARGLDIKIVADKGSSTQRYSYMPILVRKDLVDSGAIKSFADLKGRRIAENGKWGVQASTVNEALKRGGLTYGDAEHVRDMSNPQQIVAFANRAIDAAVTSEPSVTLAVEKGVAVRFSGADLYPDQQIATLFFGGDFVRRRRDVALRFMTAYLQACRSFNDGLTDGRFALPRAAGLVDILVAGTGVKDRALYAAMVANGCSPDGLVHVESMHRDLAFFRAQGVLEREIDLERVLDPTIAAEVVAAIGPYKRALPSPEPNG